MAKERSEHKKESGLYKIHVSSSGSYSIKSEDIFSNREASLSTLRELRNIVTGYKREQGEQSSSTEKGRFVDKKTK